MAMTRRMSRADMLIAIELYCAEHVSQHAAADSFTVLQGLTRDARLLFATRFIRLFAYGSLSVVLVFYLIGVGLNEAQIGMLITLTLLGDTIVSLVHTTQADRLGRRRMLLIGAGLMIAAGGGFAAPPTVLGLVVAGTPGGITPRGRGGGASLSLPQAAPPPPGGGKN